MVGMPRPRNQASTLALALHQHGLSRANLAAVFYVLHLWEGAHVYQQVHDLGTLPRIGRTG